MEGYAVDLLTEKVVTWDPTGTIRVWDVSGASKTAEFEHPTVTGISLLPGSHLASWGNDGSAMIWDLSNTEPPNLVARLHHGSLIEEVPGWGKLIFTRGSESGTIKRWEIQQSGSQVIRHPGIAGFEVDRDGRIATWGQGPAETVGEFPSSIRITQLANPSNEAQEVLFSDQLIGCDWLPSGKLISWSDNGKVRIYDEPFAKPIAEETLPGLFRLTLSVDRKNAIAICRQQRSIDINALAISEIGITRIGRLEVSQYHDARYRGPKELLICVDAGIFHADLAQSEIEFNLRTPEGTKLRLGKFSSDGTKAIVAKDSGALALWHDDKLESIDATLSKDGPSANLSVDGKHIIAWDRAQVLLIETTNRQISELPFHDRNTIGGIIGNNRILTWSENELRLSSLDDKSGITTMSHGGIGRYETAVTFSPDGRWIVSCGGKLANLWDADNGDLLLQLRHSYEVKYSRFIDQETLITLSDGDEATIWRLTADKSLDVPAITGTFLDASGRLKVK
jgi:WD40 repeat protein